MGWYPSRYRTRPDGGRDVLSVLSDGVRPTPAGTLWAVEFLENGYAIRPPRAALAEARALLQSPGDPDPRVVEELALRRTVAARWGAAAAGLVLEARPARALERAFWEIRSALPMGYLVPWLAGRLGEVREIPPPHRRWGEGGKFRDGFLTPPIPDPLPSLREAMEIAGGELRVHPPPEDPAGELLEVARALFRVLHQVSLAESLRRWAEAEALAEQLRTLWARAREILPVLMVWPGREAAAIRLVALLEALEETPPGLLPRTAAELAALRERRIRALAERIRPRMGPASLCEDAVPPPLPDGEGPDPAPPIRFRAPPGPE